MSVAVFAVGFYGLLAAVLLVGEARRCWRLYRAREQARLLVECAAERCRHGAHRTTLDVEYQQVYCTGDPYAHEIRERCVDCGWSVSFGRVTTFTAPHRRKKAHG